MKSCRPSALSKSSVYTNEEKHESWDVMRRTLDYIRIMDTTTVFSDTLQQSNSPAAARIVESRLQRVIVVRI